MTALAEGGNGVLEPSAGLTYERLHCAGRDGWWRPVVGAISLITLLLVVGPEVIGIGFAAWFAIRGQDVDASLDRLGDTAHVTPSVLAYVNLTLAIAIPITVLLTRYLHGMSPGWLVSVVGRFRWRWFAGCLGLAAVTLVATLIVSSIVPADSETDLGGQVHSFTATTLDFVLVIVVLTPLQAAGEEFLFRGYLMQACGGVISSRIATVVVPAVLFALAHGTQNVPLFFDRLAFGLVAGILVIVTGGLEAGIAMHVLNNFVAYGLALAFGSISDSLNSTTASWWNIPVTLTQSLLYLALTWWATRRQGIVRVTA
ncbi:MAG: type II CAAX endopeptidase family protein [Nocardioides sp.]|uniref:CPBP family intramembrane glutamic endopeptidase n=1 Tax=Nocardioides sp. TaxID=35761 RepID=UPI0039E609B7